ncbi:MAG: hypothetical protein Q8S33_30815 [Myxococcales bacterium]|nr:hypothetical protein [Myxococcales bacterium]
MRTLSLFTTLLLVGCGSAELTTGGSGGGGSAQDGGARAGGSAGGAGGSSAGGASGGGSVTGGGSAGGSSAGGSAAGGSATSGGSAAGGSAGGSSAGGSAGGGSAGGSAGGGSAGCSASTCASGCCLNGTCQPGTQLLACGTGGAACETCMPNQACTAQQCGLDPQSMWRVRATTARIAARKLNGDNWDGFGGDPDGYVNLYCPATSSSVTDSSSEVTNSFTPMWTDSECTMTASALLTSGFAFAVFDADGLLGGADDLIAPKTTVMVTEATLMAGTVMRGPVSALTSITFTFTRM